MIDLDLKLELGLELDEKCSLLNKKECFYRYFLSWQIELTDVSDFQMLIWMHGSWHSLELIEPELHGGEVADGLELHGGGVLDVEMRYRVV